MSEDQKKSGGQDSEKGHQDSSSERGGEDSESIILSEERQKGMTVMPVQPPPNAEVDEVGGLPAAEAPKADAPSDHGEAESADPGPSPDSGE